MSKSKFEEHKDRRLNELRIREAYHPLSTVQPRNIKNINGLNYYKEKMKRKREQKSG